MKNSACALCRFRIPGHETCPLGEAINDDVVSCFYFRDEGQEYENLTPFSVREFENELFVECVAVRHAIGCGADKADLLAKILNALWQSLVCERTGE